MILIRKLVWVSVQPLLQLFLCVASGFAITKMDLFPAMAARGAGQVILNITLPSLMFSRIVPAFNSSNIAALGPLIFVALLYEVIGITISWMIKQLFWVPHRFRYGILVAGGWANVGDVPTSIMMSLTAGAPFDGTSDQNLAVAYISVFLLVFLITLFPLGGANFVAVDFHGPDIADEDIRGQLKVKQKYLGAVTKHFLISSRAFFSRSPRVEDGHYDNEKMADLPSDPPIPSVHLSEHPALEATTTAHHAEPESKPLRQRLVQVGTRCLQTLITPCSLSIILGLVISIVPALKALFVPEVPGTSIPPAPDGQPPLAILINTATFIGDASVPLGLINLGAALARLEIPDGQLCSLPLGAVSALAIGRMVVMPVLGVLITRGLTHAGLLDPKDNVLLLVCILMSGLPSSTTQVILTQVYSGTGKAQHLSIFLIPQYLLMFITMTTLTVYVLHLLFG